MAEWINSPLFGRVQLATEEERDAIACLVMERPVDVFGILNKALNQRGMCLSIERIDGRPA